MLSSRPPALPKSTPRRHSADGNGLLELRQSDSWTLTFATDNLADHELATFEMGYSLAFVPSAANSRPTRPFRSRPVCRPRWQCVTDRAGSVSRRSFNLLLLSCLAVPAASARQEGVNRPDLLPTEQTPVIDLERFLASGELRRLRERVSELEGRTGFKVRVLTQRFPQTPGLAVRDYWGVDDDTVVMVADYFGGAQLLKFNVGRNVDRVLPPRFWSVLASEYGNKFYVQKNGEAAAIVNAVESIRVCLLRNGCPTPPNLNPAF